jgi:hypothetical protein
MDFCKDTCDDQRVGRPATGKTPLRNLRLDDQAWLPALAGTVANGTTVTDLVDGTLRDHGSAPLDRPLTFGNWPDAAPWLEEHYPRWTELAAEIEATAPGLADTEYIGVALWLAMTRHRGRGKPAGDRHGHRPRNQQQHVMAGFLLRCAMTAEPGGWREKYEDPDALLEAINQVLDEHLPGGPAA